MDKFQMIEDLIVRVDTLAEARGVARCAQIVEIVQRLDALRALLKGEGEHANADS